MKKHAEILDSLVNNLDRAVYYGDEETLEELWAYAMANAENKLEFRERIDGLIGAGIMSAEELHLNPDGSPSQDTGLIMDGALAMFQGLWDGGLLIQVNKRVAEIL